MAIWHRLGAMDAVKIERHRIAVCFQDGRPKRSGRNG